MVITDWPADERPRVRLLARGYGACRRRVAGDFVSASREESRSIGCAS